MNKYNQSLSKLLFNRLKNNNNNKIRVLSNNHNFNKKRI